MEVADDRRTQTLLLESFDDVGDGLGRIVIVDSDADDFAAGPRQSGHLLDCSGNIRGVGIGHGLHHNRCTAADADAADGGGEGFSTLNLGHIRLYFIIRSWY